METDSILIVFETWISFNIHGLLIDSVGNNVSLITGPYAGGFTKISPVVVKVLI